MKLKTFIKQLQKIQEKHGNIEVTVDGGYWEQDETSDFRYITPYIGTVQELPKVDEDGNPIGTREYQTLVLNKYAF